MNQQEVWDTIAEPWHRFRKKPYEDLKEFLQNKKSLILDLGCGSGRNFIAGKRYVGVDFSVNMLRYAKEHAEKNGIELSLIKADITKLPLKSGAFDTVLLVASLHTIEKREEVLREMKRAMRKGGEAFVTVWNRMQPRFALARKESYIPWKVDGETYLRYYYLFTQEELRKMLSKYFIVKKISGSEEKAFKLFPKNIIAIVRKPKVKESMQQNI